MLVTNMRNFPLSRGTVAGILKGYAGLSAAVFTEIYLMLLKNSSSKLLLLLALGIPCLCLLMMYFVRACTPASGEDSRERGHFLFILLSSVVLGLFLLGTTISDHMVHLNSSISYVSIAIMIFLLLAPLAIPIKMTFYRQRTASSSDLVNQPIRTQDPSEDGNDDKIEPLLKPSSSATECGSFYEGDDISEVAMLLAEGEGAIKKKRRPKRGEDFKFREAVIKADFWLLFLVYFVGVGSSVTVLNNLAQIGIAQGVHDTTILLSLFSFCNFLGRIGSGSVSEHFVRLVDSLPFYSFLTNFLISN